MAKRNQQTFAKREREHKKAEKQAQKRARRAAIKDGTLEVPESAENIQASDYYTPDEEEEPDGAE